MTAPGNPPAFPRTGEGFGNPKYGAEGMMLRDWFAGQALAGWLASYGDSTEHPASKAGAPTNIAAHSYALADAMLAAREVQP